jgi:hypothetical protein
MSKGLTRFTTTFARYGLGSVFVLGVKLALTYLFLVFFNPFWAYLLVHVFVFFVSYWVHTTWSFRVQDGAANILSYLHAVLAFKVADYVVFSVVFSLLHIQALWCVIIATLFIAVIRFACVRRVLEPQPPAAKK